MLQKPPDKFHDIQSPGSPTVTFDLISSMFSRHAFFKIPLNKGFSALSKNIKKCRYRLLIEYRSPRGSFLGAKPGGFHIKSPGLGIYCSFIQLL